MSKHRISLPIALSTCLFIALLLSISAAAQSSSPSSERSPNAPTGIGTFLTYQGQLADKDGAPVETSVQMVFRLYDAGGSVIYTSATRTVTPTKGLFTVYIGAPPDPGMTTWVLSNVAEVGVTVNDDPEMSPRQPINTVVGASVAGVGVAGNSQTGPRLYGYSAYYIGVEGYSDSGIGVKGTTSTTERSIAGVYGENSGSGSGVYGFSDAGAGVYGGSINEVGVRAHSSNYVALWAISDSSIGVVGMAHGNDGVSGYTDSTSSNHAGVKGQNGGSGAGVEGQSSVGNIGVKGTTSSTNTSNAGVYGENNGSGAGVYGWSNDGPGVYGSSVNEVGVSGTTNSTELTHAGVSGNNGGSGAGVYGWSEDGPGVYGGSANEVGVRAYSAGYVALWANSETSIGVVGMSHGNDGVSGYTDSTSSNHAGVKGQNGGSGAGVYGASNVGPGVYAQTITGTAAGYFTATNPSLATAIFLNGSGSNVLQLRNGGAAGSDSDGSGGGNFIEAVNIDEQDVQFRVTTSGTVESDGAYTTHAADFAEMLPAVAGVAPGDVLVIGADGQLQPSTQPYQLTVVGVYSTRPGFVGGQGIDESIAGQVPLAIMGVVPVKVSAENGAIRPGDLLVASATPAHAMRASANPPNGTVIGKALGTLTQETGVIQILVMLQ